MAYTRRYVASYAAHNGKSYEISIYSELGTGTDADLGNILADGLSITWEGGDVNDPLYPIVASALDINFIVDHNSDL